MTTVKETPAAPSPTNEPSTTTTPPTTVVATTTTTTTASSTTAKSKPVEKESSPAPRSNNRSTSRSKSAASTSNDQAQSPVNGAAAAASIATALTNGNGIGASTNGKRNSKQRWVPLDIDLSKSRSKRDSTPRNKRRDIEYEDDYSSERPARSAHRYRKSSYRGGRTSAISRGGRRSVNGKNSAAARSRNDADYLDYPSEYTLVNKAGTDVPPFMMPYLGTYYYSSGVSGFGNMDSMNIKDAIKKQM